MATSTVETKKAVNSTTQTSTTDNTQKTVVPKATIQLLSKRSLLEVVWKQTISNDGTATKLLKTALSVETLNNVVLTSDIESAVVYLIKQVINEIPTYGAETRYDESLTGDDANDRAKNNLIAAYGSIENFKAGGEKRKQVVLTFNCPTLRGNFVVTPTLDFFNIIQEYVASSDDLDKGIEIAGRFEIVKPSANSVITENYARFVPEAA